MFDSILFYKVWLKAAKIVSLKCILLKFVCETRTKSPYLPSKVTLLQLFTSFSVATKKRNDLQPFTTTSKNATTTHKQSNTILKEATNVKQQTR